jgi:hypothetical protein
MQVVYFRANRAGACDYVNDSRYWRYSHGTCWSELTEDLLVVDVPGDHFSLLRQDPPDMEVRRAHLPDMCAGCSRHLVFFGGCLATQSAGQLLQRVLGAAMFF